MNNEQIIQRLIKELPKDKTAFSGEYVIYNQTASLIPLTKNSIIVYSIDKENKEEVHQTLDIFIESMVSENLSHIEVEADYYIDHILYDSSNEILVNIKDYGVVDKSYCADNGKYTEASYDFILFTQTIIEAFFAHNKLNYRGLCFLNALIDVSKSISISGLRKYLTKAHNISLQDIKKYNYFYLIKELALIKVEYNNQFNMSQEAVNRISSIMQFLADENCTGDFWTLYNSQY